MGASGGAAIVMLAFFVLVVATPIAILCSTKRATAGIRTSYAVSSVVFPAVAALLASVLSKGIPGWLSLPVLVLVGISPYLVRAVFVAKHPDNEVDKQSNSGLRSHDS
jgi:ABC-type proline/glycine betaine transport system permease subunit